MQEVSIEVYVNNRIKHCFFMKGDEDDLTALLNLFRSYYDNPRIVLRIPETTSSGVGERTALKHLKRRT